MNVFRRMILILALAGLPFCHRKAGSDDSETSSQPTQVFKSTLNQETIADILGFPAMVQAERRIDLASEIGGIVSRINVLTGDATAQRKILVEISNPDPLAGFRAFKVLAPFAGEVGQVYVQAGDRVTAGQKLLQLVDPASIRFPFQLSPDDITRVRKGMEGEWIALNGSIRYPVVITAISRVLDEKLGTSAGEMRLKDRQDLRQIVSGMMGMAKIKAQSRQATLVPETAVFYKGKKPHLIVIGPEAKARYVEISIVSRFQDKIEIHTDIPSGTDIVSQASSYISEGETLAITEGQHRD